MSAFIRGLQAGTAAAQGWVDTYEAARKRREEKELKESLKRAGEIEQTTVALPESYAPAAPTESQQVTTQYGLRTPTPNEIGRARAETQALAEQDAQTFQEYQAGGLSRYGTPFSETEVQRARTEAMARAYEQAGNPAEAMRMRQLAQQQEATGLQLTAERRRIQKEETNQAALRQVSESFAQGKQLDVPNIYEIANQTGADPALLVRAAADNLELTQKQVDSINKRLIQNIRTASTSPEKFNKLLAEQFDPDPTDNIKPELRAVGNGYQVFYGDRQISPMFRDDKDISALSQLSQYYQNQIQGKPLETAVQVATLEKLRSSIAKDSAEAAAAGPKATAEGVRQNILLADQYRKQLSDIDAQLNSGFYPEDSKGFTALLAQRNAINRALTDVNRLLQPGGLTRGGAQTAAPVVDEVALKAARDVARSGINPETNKPFTKADKEKFEEYFGEPFPEPAPAQPPKPASPRAARAARPDKIPPAPPQTITTRGGVTRANPEYLEWERQYGTPSGLR